MKPFRIAFFYLPVLFFLSLVFYGMLPGENLTEPAESNFVRINLGKTDTIRVFAEEFYSATKVEVSPGEKYIIAQAGEEKWKDSWISAGIDGYSWNVLACVLGLRVPSASCMSLCATYNELENEAFLLAGTDTLTIERDGRLSFFANDVPAFYDNNSGSLAIAVTRVE